MPLTQLSLTEVAGRICTRDLSPVEVTQACLERIETSEPHINAFVTVTPEDALRAARAAEQEIAAGRYRGPLHGVPVAVKDLFDMDGLPTTASSKVRANHVATQDSACVERLREAGAVIVGKTQMHEFAFGILTPNTRNPWKLDHSPGGSSGGSGAAVAAGSCYMALGSDTGGSIRIPASVCGTVGLKPTYGRVSRFGVVPLSWSADHVGPLTRTVQDAALTLNVISGHDPRDPASAKTETADFCRTLDEGVRGVRLGVPSNYFFDQLDPEVEASVRTAIKVLEAEGAEIREVELPLAEQMLPAGFTICLAEAAAYHRATLQTHGDQYQDDVRALLELGMLVPAADYITAQRVRERIKQAWREAFADLDAIVAPTTAAPAAKADQTSRLWSDGTEEPIMSAYARLTGPADVTGQPAISIPCGFSADRLPIGLQIVGRPFEEATVLRIARAYEAASGRDVEFPTI